MLHPKTIEIVKASAPALAARGREVTERMYELMFAADPEVRRLFTGSNQASGRQPVALANAVHAYAVNIENPGVLAPALELIANKHASLGIKPEHYSIVAEHLLQALADVLALNEEQLDAWAQAYGFLADTLVAMERGLYESAAGREGGWDGHRTFVIDRVERESEVIKSFYLKPADGRPTASFEPGQYVTVKLDFPGGNTVTRNYSLSDAPGRDHYRISVKAERRGRGAPRDGLVSSYLHDHALPGMKVELRAPMGAFVLDATTARPVVLLAGGVGITPMMSMLETIAERHPGLETHVVHAALNGRAQAFGARLRRLAAERPNISVQVCYSEPDADDPASGHCDKTGFVTREWVRTFLPNSDCDFYLCGPAPFMRQMFALLIGQGASPERIAHEFFGPADELVASEPESRVA